MKFAVIANPNKYSVKEPFIQLLNWSDDHEVQVIFCAELQELYRGEDHPSAVVVEHEESAIDQADITIALGGDGTMLYTARLMKNIQKPILGVNSGRLGFMAYTQKENLHQALNYLLEDNYRIDKRYLLEASDSNGTIYHALNEFLFSKKDSTSIGRFEITNAQYAEFDEEHVYPEVRANYPATGISKEQARQYIDWLNDQTDESYRLPNADEAEKLHEQAQKIAQNENTLNYWAGYDITIDEVPEFRQKLTDLDQSMLKEVGAYKSVKVGEAPVYDLGGNAAEWYTGSNGNSTYGYSAVSFVDDRDETSTAPAEYTGFRVIKE